jgi:hypothetical protein
MKATTEPLVAVMETGGGFTIYDPADFIQEYTSRQIRPSTVSILRTTVFFCIILETLSRAFV